MLQRLFVLTLVALASVAVAAAQERPGTEPKRGAYVVKYAAAKDLAAILRKHFKGAAEVQAGPEDSSNCLLVNAPPAVFDEVMNLLDKLDRRPQSVVVEVIVVELPAKKAHDKGKGPDEYDLSGPIDEVVERLGALLRRGQVAGFKHLRLTTLEGQPASLTQDENKPFATAANSFAYRMVGTHVRVTPQVTADRSVTLDLSVQDSRDRDSAGTPGHPEFVLTSLTGKVRVASGKAVLAKDAKVISEEGRGETLLVVGARIMESGAAGK
jgi:type II secretory pathway component GspD/PulD (secretin)